jgi:predicted nucleic acid-binding protein
VLFELHGLLLNRINRQIAWNVLASLRASQAIIRVGESDETRAEYILSHYDDKAFSYTDALSFAVMERLGRHAAFSLDRHFAQYGWTMVPVGESGSRT